MKKRFSEEQIVLFLGAGFSVEAHQPIMNTFGNFSEAQYWGSLKDSYAGGFKGIIKHSHYDSSEILKNSGEIFEALRNKCKLNSSCGFNPDNMEDLFTYAEMREQCNYENISLNIQDAYNQKISKIIKNAELVKEIKIWLWQIFRRVPINNPSKWKIQNKEIDRAPYLDFMDKIISRGVGNFSVLTTNYDLIIEYLCNYVGNHKVYYPINDYIPKSVNESTTGNYLTENRGSPSLSYCKLHGSVNYFEASNDPGKIYINSELGGKRGKSGIKDKLPSVTALDSAIYILKTQSLFPAIIPPTYAKLEKRVWLQDIWSAALKSLINSNKWIFIGYSFPPTDGHMKSLINLALMEKTTSPSIVLVSPDSSVIENYEIFTEQNFRFYEKSFSRFVEEDFENEIK